MAKLFGESNPGAFLNWKDVQDIRALGKKHFTVSELAGEFAISKRQVRRILRRENWSRPRGVTK